MRREGRYEKTPGTAPFTIFYNGTLSVFDLTDDMAQGLIKFAMEKSWEVKLHVNHIHTSSNAPAQDILQQLNQGGTPFFFFEFTHNNLIS